MDKKHLYLITASILLAKRYYENVVLYTDKKTAEIIRKIELPYTEINDTLLNNVKVGTYTIPKLLVYAEQKEPFLHIDLDSLIYKKFDLIEGKDIYFAYNERKTVDFNLFNSASIEFYKMYVLNTYTIMNNLPKDFVSKIDLNDIPNMSLFGGYNVNIISKASEYCLDIYEKNKDFIDIGESFNGVFIEQLFIPIAIKLLNQKSDFNFKYLYNQMVTYFDYLGENKFDFPFKVISTDKSIVFNDESDLYLNYKYDFNGYLHLSGSQHFDKIFHLIRPLILLELKGEKYINKIDENFPHELGFDKDFNFYKQIK